MAHMKGVHKRTHSDCFGDGHHDGNTDAHADRLRADPGYLEFELDQALIGLLRFGRPVAEEIVGAALKRHGFEVRHERD